MVNLGPIALFSSFISTTFSGKHLEDISLRQIVSLLHKLNTSVKDTDHLYVGFDRDRKRRQQELTKKQKVKR